MKKDLNYYNCRIKEVKYGYSSYARSAYCSIIFDSLKFREFYTDRQMDLFLNNPFDAKILELLHEKVFGCSTFVGENGKDLKGIKVRVGIHDLATFDVREINGLNFDDLMLANPDLLASSLEVRQKLMSEFIIPENMDIKFAGQIENKTETL